MDVIEAFRKLNQILDLHRVLDIFPEIKEKVDMEALKREESNVSRTILAYYGIPNKAMIPEN